MIVRVSRVGEDFRTVSEQIPPDTCDSSHEASGQTLAAPRTSLNWPGSRTTLFRVNSGVFPEVLREASTTGPLLDSQKPLIWEAESV